MWAELTVLEEGLQDTLQRAAAVFGLLDVYAREAFTGKRHELKTFFNADIIL